MLFIFLTPALVFLTEFRGNRETLLELSVNIRSLPLSMKALYGDAHTFGQHDVAAKDYFEQYRPLVESEDATLRIFENATKELLTEAQEDYVAFSQAYLLGGVFEGQRSVPFPFHEKNESGNSLRFRGSRNAAFHKKAPRRCCCVFHPCELPLK